MTFIKRNRVPMMLASIHWFLTTVFQNDRLFFVYDKETRIFIIIKILYFICLNVIWCFALYIYKKTKERNEIYTRGIYIFTIYLSVLMSMLVILWPGTWSSDDLWILNAIQYYNSLGAWQHIITGLYQDILLQILPFPGGIILIQNIIISVCVAFVITKLEISFKIRILKCKWLDIGIKLLPFLLPPVLMYQFSGYRMGMYIYVELAMLVMLICGIKNDIEWSKEYLILFCVLCIIASTWRTESFLYIPFSCVCILFVNKDIVQEKKKVICIIILLIGFVGVNTWQNRALGNSNYKVVSLLRPCAELVRISDSVEDAQILNDINRVANIEVIRDNPAINGEVLYWNYNVVRSDYSKEDYNAFLKAFVKLCLKYPRIVIIERWNLFVMGTGITGTTATNVGRAADLFDIDNGNSAAEVTLSKGWVANRPIFKSIRKNFINILGCRKPDGTVLMIMQRLIWNSAISILILICAWIRLLKEKKWYLLLICSSVLVRLPIIILTQPSAWLMYVLSFYFLGYVYLVYRLLIFWGNKNK